MGGELLFIHLGQCGCQIGSTLWKLFAKEFSLNSDGKLETTTLSMNDCTSNNNNNIHKLFEESTREENKFTSRSLFFDSDPFIIDSLRTTSSEIHELMQSENLVSHHESANNFGNAKYTIGREYDHYLEERIRKMKESCDQLDGIVFTHSIGGGTGSGSLDSLLVSSMVEKGLTMSSFSVFPTEDFFSIEPYNAVLCLDRMRSELRNIFAIENDSVFEFCKSNGIENVDFNHINHVISQMISSFLSPILFSSSSSDNEQKNGTTTFKSISDKLVPYPSMNIISNFMTNVENSQVKIDGPELFSVHNSMSGRRNRFNNNSMNELPIQNSCNFSTAVSMRGVFSQNQIDNVNHYMNNSLTMMHKQVSYTEKSVIQNEEPKLSNIIHTAYNTTAIKHTIKTIHDRFDLLYNNGSHVITLVGEGLESGELEEGTQNLQNWIGDYEDLEKDIVYDIIHKKH